MNRIEQLTQNLHSLQPTQLEIIDDSHLHAHHTAMKGITGQHTHLHVKIASPEFAGKSRVQIHRLIQKCAEDEMAKGLHALQITILK